MRFRESLGPFQRAQCPFCASVNYMQVPSPSSIEERAQEPSLGRRGAGQDFYSAFTLTPEQARASEAPYTKAGEQNFRKDEKQDYQDYTGAIFSKPPSKGQRVLAKIIALWKFWNTLSRKRRLLLAACLPAVSLFFIIPLFLSFYFLPGLYLEQDPLEYMERIQNNSPNQILGRGGGLLAELFSVKTGTLKAGEIPKPMKDIIVFIEDQHFYEHAGIHWPSIVRAAFLNLFSLAYRQGGSTITQQLARILLLEKQKTLLRKCKEAALAYALEREMSKAEILAAYLNLVYLGHGAYGIANASELYFQKKIDELNFAQQLMLASLPSAPERYSPLRHPHLLKVKMGAIMERMRADSFPVPYNYPEQRRLSFYNLNRSPSANVYHDRLDHAPYVTEYIRQKIGQILGKEYMYNAGLRIETSLDLNLQQASVEESKSFIAKHAARFPPTRYAEGKVIKNSKEEKVSRAFQEFSLALMLKGYPQLKDQAPYLQAAAIGIENKSGKIVFLQGGHKFGVNNQLNRAVDMYRQTGSAIKPIIYALAIEKGVLHAASLLDDRPIFEAKGLKDKAKHAKKEGAQNDKTKNNKANNKKTKTEKDYWTPANYGGVYEGPISIRRALTYSKNLPAIQTARLLGMQSLQEGFANFFFPDKEVMERRFRADETLAIGSLEMSPMEMALAYSALGNNGYIQRPRLILAIYDAKGQQLYNSEGQDEFQLGFQAERRQVLSGDTAEIIINLLSGASRHGGVGREAQMQSRFVGKTGTSNDYRDAWFIGLSPEITAALWLGFDNPSFSMPGGTGASLAGPLWGRIMQHQKRSKEGFKFSPRAKEAKICPLTGSLYRSSCLVKAQRELFRKKDNLQKLLSKDLKTKKRQVSGPAKKESLLNFSEF